MKINQKAQEKLRFLAYEDDDEDPRLQYYGAASENDSPFARSQKIIKIMLRPGITAQTKNMRREAMRI
jgi:hypothetical protein